MWMTNNPTDDSPLIKLSDVTKRYPRRKEEDVIALDNINLSVPKGDIHGIVGQSGAGKSTLIRCLCALEKPTSGSITVAGKDLSKLRSSALRQARLNIGMVFQNANLLDSRTAAGNIGYALSLAGVKFGKRHERVQEMLDLVGLSARGSSYPAQLSGGQRQRVGIARALATNPPVLLCDEPTSALDSESTRQILQLISDVRDRLGVTVLIITHEMGVVREICDSVTMLENGQVIQSGRIEDVLEDPQSRLSRELVPPPSIEDEPVLNGQSAAVVDVAFTAHPGEPKGSAVMSAAARIGADIVAGTFETVGQTQVGRLALAVPPNQVNETIAAMRNAGTSAEVRDI